MCCSQCLLRSLAGSVAFHCPSSNVSTPLMKWDIQNWKVHSRCGLTSTEQINCFPWPLGWFLLIQPSVIIIHGCWFIFNFCFASTRVLFCRIALSPSPSFRTWLLAFLNFMHLIAVTSTFPAYQGPFERYTCSPEYPPLPQVWCRVKLLRESCNLFLVFEDVKRCWPHALSDSFFSTDLLWKKKKIGVVECQLQRVSSHKNIYVYVSVLSAWNQ